MPNLTGVEYFVPHYTTGVQYFNFSTCTGVPCISDSYHIGVRPTVGGVEMKEGGMINAAMRPNLRGGKLGKPKKSYIKLIY